MILIGSLSETEPEQHILLTMYEEGPKLARKWQIKLETTSKKRYSIQLFPGISIYPEHLAMG
jgi:hypothetical protein